MYLDLNVEFKLFTECVRTASDACETFKYKHLNLEDRLFIIAIRHLMVYSHENYEDEKGDMIMHNGSFLNEIVEEYIEVFDYHNRTGVKPETGMYELVTVHCSTLFISVFKKLRNKHGDGFTFILNGKMEVIPFEDTEDEY